MLRKLIQMLFLAMLVAVMLTAFVAFALSLLSGSPNRWVLVVLATVGIAALVLLVKACVVRNHPRQATRGITNQEVEVAPVQEQPKEWPNWASPDRPVMFSRKDVFDFVHNDPTVSEA